MNFPRSGGEYVYLSEAWGPAWGFVDGWVTFFAGFSAPIAVAALAIEEIDYTGAEDLVDKARDIREKLQGIDLKELAAKISGEDTGQQPDNLLNYKARPLNGIWATAPYLHNGSVPTTSSAPV